MSSGREQQLAGALHEVRERIARACTASGRDAATVTLVAVTKTFPADDVRLLAALGVTDVGENRVAELVEKRAQLTDVPVTWHFVGQVQTNKAGAVAAAADVVHSVDRQRLVDALARTGQPLRVLLQVDLAEPAGAPGAGRGGAPADEVPRLAASVAAAGQLRLAGVMGVPPRDVDPRESYARLAAVHAALLIEHPDATWRSAGMSGDLEAAIGAGATHVRVGTSLLGSRPPLR